MYKNIDYEILFSKEKNCDEIYNFDIHLKFDIDYKLIKFNGELLCWSNDLQENVLLEDSIIREFLDENDYIKCISYYENIKEDYLRYLNQTILTSLQLDEFLDDIKNPNFIYSDLLLKSFDKYTLDYIFINFFKSYSILDINNFDIFIPHNVNGWYYYGIEVDTYDNNLEIYCHNINKEITPEQMLISMIEQNKKEFDKILNFCAKKWCEYCGLSISCRTLYWDIAMAICTDRKFFEEYILLCEFGDESLNYDICCSTNSDFYENIKNDEVLQLDEEEKSIFLFSYAIFINTLYK
jgi:hypothetical protein